MVNVQMLAELEEVIQYDLVVEQRECIRYITCTQVSMSHVLKSACHMYLSHTVN